MITDLTILLLVALTAVFVVRPVWGLYALVFALPFERIGSWALHPETGHPVVRISEIVAAAWIAAVVINVGRRRIQLRSLPWPWFALLAFVTAAAISDILIGQRQLWVSYVIVLLLAATTTTITLTLRYEWLPGILNSLMASAGVVSLFGIYQFVMGTFRIMNVFTGLRAPYIRDLFGFPRIHSTALEPLYYANYLMIPLLVGIGLMLLAPASLRRWHKVALGLAALNFLLTMSRGAFIALVPAFALMILGAWRLHPKHIGWRPLAVSAALIVGLGVAAIGAASYVATGSAAKGLENFASQVTVKLTGTGSYTERVQSRKLGWQIVRQRPLFGVGLAGITPYLKGYGTERAPDDLIALNNQAIELLAETGIVGTALFYGFLVALLVRGWMRLRRTTDPVVCGWLLASMALLVGLTVQAQSFSGFFLMHLWVTYGLVLGLIALTRPEIPHKEARS